MTSIDAAKLPARPLIGGFHPDPTVCRVGDAYFLACSSFEYAPGVPIFRSADLVTWELIGHAFDRPSQLPEGAAPSGGIYAPTLRHHGGRFWLVTTNVSDGPGHVLVSATDPAGPWSDPVRITEAGGIDPDISWSDDGDDATCRLTWSDGGIRQAELDPAAGKLLTEPVQLWSGTGGRDPEGPHVFRHDEHWYLLVSEGGTGLGHAVTIARGPSPSGPFTPSPHNPLLTARGTDSPVQNTGHADLVQRPDGSWAMVFLGARPAGQFPGWHVLGRETFGAEIGWEDGWPAVVGPLQAPDDGVESRLSDVEGTLPLDWVGAGVFPGEVLATAADRWVLTAPERATQRAFVGRRQEHRRIDVEATLEVGDGAAGLELRMDPGHAVSLEVDGGRVRAVTRIGGLEHELGARAVGEKPAALRLRVERSGPGPDTVVALGGTAEDVVELGRLDGRYLSTEVAGGFTGRFVGLTAVRGTATVHGFRYTGRDA